MARVRVQTPPRSRPGTPRETSRQSFPCCPGRWGAGKPRLVLLVFSRPHALNRVLRIDDSGAGRQRPRPGRLGDRKLDGLRAQTYRELVARLAGRLVRHQRAYRWFRPVTEPIRYRDSREVVPAALRPAPVQIRVRRASPRLAAHAIRAESYRSEEAQQREPLAARERTEETPRCRL